MKNVLLIGDSIRMGYDKSVRKSLGDRANVIFPDENCKFASYLLRHFHEYYKGVKGEDIDVVHWNTGLWDCLRLFQEEPHTPVDIYAYYIDRLCARIKKLCPNAQVIFATSTSVLSEEMDKDFKRYNEDIEKYNETAVSIATEYGFKINDLYKVSTSLPREAHSDAVHYYTELGTQVFTNRVLDCIVPALGLNEEIKYCEDMYTDEPIGI